MKAFIIILSIALVGLAAGYYFYQFHFPNLVVDAVVSDEIPEYLPGKIRRRIEAVRQPLHTGAETVVVQLRKSGIPLHDAIAAIESTSVENAYALLDDLSRSPLHNKDEVFNILKKHIHADFDLEIFRESFKQQADMKVIRKAVSYGQTHRDKPAIDITAAKAILIRMLEEKDKSLTKSDPSGFR